MSKLIQKSGYIKNGNAGGYMKYIATREGVERLHGNGQATAGQKKLIQQLLDDFPDACELFEYEDYVSSPTFNTASEFITMALDMNMHDLQPGDTYMKYIATRPRVQKRGEHGLFGSENSVNLPQTLEELNEHEGNVWTLIYSLRRSDAARLGYESADSWRNLILSHKTELADAMRIPVENFRWYAAFHDESHHPHIHMMVWSSDPKQGFLTKGGIAKMRSELTNDIFEQELHSLYVKKDIAYKELTGTAQEVMQKLIESMKESDTVALISCVECGKEFSDKAKACPNCGCPIEYILGTLEKQKVQQASPVHSEEDCVPLDAAEDTAKQAAPQWPPYAKENLLSYSEMRNFAFSSILLIQRPTPKKSKDYAKLVANSNFWKDEEAAKQAISNLAATAYLDGNDIEELSLYGECHTQIAKYQQSSIEAQIIGGIGVATKGLGKAIAAVPIIREGPVDEALISAGDSIGKFNRDSAQKKLESFEPFADSRMGSFIENIQTVGLLYNTENSMLTDGNNLYVRNASAY